jgi:4-hydroxy-3-methylbut-2-en-1-yl diphosphate reductase
MRRRLEVILSPHMGYCFGVKRAMRLIDDGLARGETAIRTIGDVIHNPQAVERLRARGVLPVSSLDEIEEGQTLVIRAHGVDPAIIESARRRGIRIIDTTCPFVQRAQNYVRRIAEEGRRVIVIGDPSHPEVQGISAQAGGGAFIVQSPSQTEDLPPIEAAGVVIQTTFSRERAMEIVARLQERIDDLRVYDTICQATELRREATGELAADVDMILVVGGKGSSNTKRLYQMCLEERIPARFIETADEIDPSWFDRRERVGVTTGTSTPDWIIEEVLERLRQISRDP